MAVYKFNRTETAGHAVCASRLGMELEAVIGVMPDQIDIEQDLVEVVYDTPLTAEQELGLGQVYSGHTGEQIPYVKFYAATKLVQTEVVITQQNEWQQLGGVLTRPGFFVKNVDRSFARLAGFIKYVKVDGNAIGPELRVVRQDFKGEDLVMTNPIIHTESYNPVEWHPFEMFTTPISSDLEAEYRIEGRLNGAVSSSIKYVSLTLLEDK